MFFEALALLLLAVTLPGTLELAFLTASAWFYRPPEGGTASRSLPRIAVVIPAHDESTAILPCLASLRACEQPGADWAMIVIADNCTDDTAEVAARAGARVITRHDPERRGKGHALDFAFRQLLAEGFGAFIVVDADSLVEPNFLRAFAARFAAGAEALQCVYRAPETEADARTRLRGLLWFAFNVVRPRGREHWGLSVGILGNGFGVTRDVLMQVPYEVSSITEDLDYHLRLQSAGYRVEFLPDTSVHSALPAGEAAAGTQRARWEGGRIAAIREWTPNLIRALGQRRAWALEPLLELWLLPLSYHVMLLVPLLLIPSAWAQLYGFIALLIVVVHTVTAVGQGGRWRDLLLLAQIPVYLLWKLRMLPEVIAKAGRNAVWVRTERSS